MQVLHKFPTLYKIGPKGEVLQWDIEALVQDDGVGLIRATYGQQGGALQTAEEKVLSGKNIGRANETTIEQQTIAQAESKWTKQQDKHYAETIKKAQSKQTSSVRPMLAHAFADKEHTIEAGQLVYYQPKLDGLRIIAQKNAGQVTLLSRRGKPITALPHLNDHLNQIMENGETWDGEGYHHTMAFEDIMKFARPKKPRDGHEEISIHIFDAVDYTSYSERYINNVYQRLQEYDNGILVPVPFIEDQFCPDKMEDILEQWLDDGYEGLMVRVGDQDKYEHKRTAKLLKVKRFYDDEFKIVAAETGTPGTKKDGLLARFILETTNSKGEIEQFKSVPLGSDEKLTEMWANKDDYIGQWATVKYQELSKYGIPRFGKVKGIRWEGDR